MLALRSLGTYGLCFLDGHDDFAYPRSNKKHGLFTAAGLDLGLVTGYGPAELVIIRGLLPYVKPSNVVAFGLYQDPADEADYATEAISQTQIQVIDIHQIRAVGVQKAVSLALERLKNSDLDGLWIHLNVDVLDQSVMPCVDSPNPKGLMFAELQEILTALTGSSLAVGMEVTVFDPELDPKGKYASAFVSAIVQSFA
jgi:arginase